MTNTLDDTIKGTLSETIEAHREALDKLAWRAGTDYKMALGRIVRTAAMGGTILFSGMGKSGFIAQKAAATFRSLGIPAHYLHPSEASHGDLGAVSNNSAVVILSHSGNTPELADLILFCQQAGIPIIAVTSIATSPLGKAAEWALCYGLIKEACPHDLAPTVSCMLSMILCDALAIDAATARGFTPEDFSRYHPGGKLGARLRKARDLMKPLPMVGLGTPLTDILLNMTGSGPDGVSGIVMVVHRGMFQGIITDGDIRRNSELKFTTPEGRTRGRAKDFMTTDPLCADEHTPAGELVRLMQEARVTKIVIEDGLGTVLGVVNLHDALGNGK